MHALHVTYSHEGQAKRLDGGMSSMQIGHVSRIAFYVLLQFFRAAANVARRAARFVCALARCIQTA